MTVPMSLTQMILTAPMPVQIHIAAAVLAIALLPLTLLRKRRDRVHKLAGRVWVLAMLLVALSSFFITALAVVGPFGPIHLISLYVLFGLFHAIRSIRMGNMAAHEAGMRGLVTVAPRLLRVWRRAVA